MVTRGRRGIAIGKTNKVGDCLHGKCVADFLKISPTIYCLKSATKVTYLVWEIYKLKLINETDTSPREVYFTVASDILKAQLHRNP